MSYKQNAAANRDALFGPSSSSQKPSGGPKHKRDAASNRDALFGGASSGKSKSKTKSKTTATTGRTPSASTTTTEKPSTSTGYSYSASSFSSSNNASRKNKNKNKTNTKLTSMLSGQAKIDKMKEAEEYRQKAKKAMTRSVFSRPDPIMAGTFYKRAADCYQACGDENRLERLHRIASGDCQMGQGAYGSAAAEYMRGAELVKVSDETMERKMKEGWKLYGDAANAYYQMGEKGKAAKCRLQSALAYTWNDDEEEETEEEGNHATSKVLSQNALKCIEEAIEAHVPDPLNRYARYRQTGTSAYVDPNDALPPTGSTTPKYSKQTMELCRNAVVTTPFAHEPLVDLISTLVEYREYTTALYAAGAASAILEQDGIATISLDRLYGLETILTLAMGDCIQAEQVFLNVHVQHTSYLSSRECKMSEDLFRAIKMRDDDALEEARSPQGSNRACLANLRTDALRLLVQELRVNGIARPVKHKKKNQKKKTYEEEPSFAAAPMAPAPAAAPEWTNPAPSDPPLVTATPIIPAPQAPAATAAVAAVDDKLDEPEDYDANALHAEMDDLMADMGLDDLSSEEEELSDDDIDLR